MSADGLYLSFWHVGLGNLPEGKFIRSPHCDRRGARTPQQGAARQRAGLCLS